MGWTEAGFPNPYLVPIYSVAKAMFEALLERLRITQNGRNETYLDQFTKPVFFRQFGERNGVNSYVGSRDIMAFVDFWLLRMVLPLYYDKETFDGDADWTSEPHYRGYSETWTYHIYMKRSDLIERGLHEGEELVEWQCGWTNGADADTASPDNPNSYPLRKENTFVAYFAQWADQRRRFLNLLKYREFDHVYSYMEYSKRFVDVDLANLDYGALVRETVSNPDQAIQHDNHWLQHGYFIYYSGEDDYARPRVLVSVYDLKSINVDYVEGYSLAGHELIFKYKCEQHYNAVSGLPYQDGQHEWKPTAGRDIATDGRKLLFSNHWDSVTIPMEYNDKGEPKNAYGWIIVNNSFLATDISDTFTYKE